MTDKRTPTDLEAFKAAFDRPDRLRATGAAIKSAGALGFGRAEIVAAVRRMERPHFRKPTTAHLNHRVWQDVYHVPSDAGLLYVKFTVDTTGEFVLLSFKEKDDG